MRTVRFLVMAVTGAVAVTIAMVSPASAAYGSPAVAVHNQQVIPPKDAEFVTGKTYGEWSAAWWKYAVEAPVPVNPLRDQTGAGCNLGQSGPVFFLVGTENGGTATRDHCTVPAGKALFFPLFNAFWANNPGEDLDDWDVWRALRNYFGPTFKLYASIDGTPVRGLNPYHTPYRACAGPADRCSADPFSLTLPADNIFNAPAGVYEPTVADGYYLLLPPLTPGSHTITFGGTGLVAGETTSQDITYKLTVG